MLVIENLVQDLANCRFLFRTERSRHKFNLESIAIPNIKFGSDVREDRKLKLGRSEWRG